MKSKLMVLSSLSLLFATFPAFAGSYHSEPVSGRATGSDVDAEKAWKIAKDGAFQQVKESCKAISGKLQNIASVEKGNTLAITCTTVTAGLQKDHDEVRCAATMDGLCDVAGFGPVIAEPAPAANPSAPDTTFSETLGSDYSDTGGGSTAGSLE